MKIGEHAPVCVRVQTAHAPRRQPMSTTLWRSNQYRNRTNIVCADKEKEEAEQNEEMKVCERGVAENNPMKTLYD